MLKHGTNDGTNVEPNAQQIQQMRNEYRFLLKWIQLGNSEDRFRNQKSELLNSNEQWPAGHSTTRGQQRGIKKGLKAREHQIFRTSCKSAQSWRGVVGEGAAPKQAAKTSKAGKTRQEELKLDYLRR